LPTDWRATPVPADLATIGDLFVREMRAAIFIVPSTLAPAESNWLINPMRPDFFRILLRSRTFGLN